MAIHIHVVQDSLYKGHTLANQGFQYTCLVPHPSVDLLDILVLLEHIVHLLVLDPLDISEGIVHLLIPDLQDILYHLAHTSLLSGPNAFHALTVRLSFMFFKVMIAEVKEEENKKYNLRI
jgi:hypothetical protein